MDNEKDLIVITGTDSGIGQSLSQIFLEHGYTVLATYLEKASVKNAINIKLDVKKKEDIIRVAKKVNALINNGKNLQGLINNAGIALGGPIEDLPIEIYKHNFEVNFFGLIQLTQQLIPYLIKSKGRILIHGSAAGRVAVPFLSPYVGTKYALEGFTDCLRREFAPYGIKTILLETGGVATPIWQKATKQDISFMSAKYLKSMDLFKEKFILGKKGLTAQQAARKFFQIFKKKNPRPRYIVAKNHLRERLIRNLPARLLDGVFKKLFKMDYR